MIFDSKLFGLYKISLLFLVFGDTDLSKKRDSSVGLVPLMQFNELTYSVPLDASSNSLSSSLLRHSMQDENALAPTSLSSNVISARR